MNTPYGQRGMTLVSWMLTLLLIGFFAMLALKLIPVYIDGYKVYQSVESLRSDTKPASSVTELRTRLLKRLDINMVTDVQPRDISMERRGNFISVNVNYEVRKSLFGNIDLVVSFDKTAEVPLRP